MPSTAFLTASPVHSRKPHRLAEPPTRIPTCGLSDHLATAAAAAVTLSLSVLPLPSQLAYADTTQYAYHPRPSLTVTTAHAAPTSTALVVGVGKSAIHDYLPNTDRQPVTHTARSVENPLDEDARREFCLAARLVTAVLLGVMLGVERRATSLNLGVRSITLISVSTALVSLLAGCDSGLLVPAIASAPHVMVAAAAATTGLAVYAAARLRQRRTRHVPGMCWTVALAVAMGGACGAGLSLLSVGAYLAAVAVMRANGKKKVIQGRKVGVSTGRRGGGYRRVTEGSHRNPLDSVVNRRLRDGADGYGVSL